MPTTVRPRTATDLATCVQVLADAHRADGYPMDWPVAPSSWLSPEGVQGAWVAESVGTLVGHAVLAGPGDDARRAADRLVALSRLFVPGVPAPRAVGPRAQRSTGRAASGAHGGGVRGGQHLVRLPHRSGGTCSAPWGS